MLDWNTLKAPIVAWAVVACASAPSAVAADYVYEGRATRGPLVLELRARATAHVPGWSREAPVQIGMRLPPGTRVDPIETVEVGCPESGTVTLVGSEIAEGCSPNEWTLHRGSAIPTVRGLLRTHLLLPESSRLLPGEPLKVRWRGSRESSYGVEQSTRKPERWLYPRQSMSGDEMEAEIPRNRIVAGETYSLGLLEENMSIPDACELEVLRDEDARRVEARRAAIVGMKLKDEQREILELSLLIEHGLIAEALREVEGRDVAPTVFRALAHAQLLLTCRDFAGALRVYGPRVERAEAETPRKSADPAAAGAALLGAAKCHQAEGRAPEAREKLARAREYYAWIGARDRLTEIDEIRAAMDKGGRAAD